MNFLKPALVGVLKRCGLEVRSSRRDVAALQQLAPTPSSGRILELIGTQGVGKTTLNNALYLHLKDRWFFRGDLRYTGPSSVAAGVLEALHRDIYFCKLEHLKAHQPDAWKSLTTGRQMSNVICESLLISTHDFPRGFILDEGLFKNFAEELLAFDLDRTAPLWRNRAFIHLRAKDPDVALARLQNRRDSRRRSGMFQHDETAEDLRARILRDNGLCDRIVEIAQSLGCPAETVYVEDGLESNIRQTLEFEKSLESWEAAAVAMGGARD